MGAITGTLVKASELSGDYKILQVSCVPASASDTVTLTAAAHGISEIAGIIAAEVREGQDADLQTAHATFSGLVITVATLNGAGTAATNWTSAVVVVTVLAK
jgi:hypothetical protein